MFIFNHFAHGAGIGIYPCIAYTWQNKSLSFSSISLFLRRTHYISLQSNGSLA